MLPRWRDRRGMSFSLIGLLIVGAIIAFLFAKMTMRYIGTSSSSVQQAVAQTGVAVTPVVSPGGSAAQATGVLEWSRQKIKAAGQRDVDRAKQLTELNF